MVQVLPKDSTKTKSSFNRGPIKKSGTGGFSKTVAAHERSNMTHHPHFVSKNIVHNWPQGALRARVTLDRVQGNASVYMHAHTKCSDKHNQTVKA